MRKRERRGRTTAKKAAMGGALAAGVIGLWAGPAAASWPGNTPPNPLAPVPTTATQVDLSSGITWGSASIAGDEVDWYTFVAPRSGSHSVWTSTSTNPPDTVLALYDSAGNLLASNDDYAPPDRDSQVDVTLVQGARYYFGITNYTNTGPGAYDYYLRAPK